MAQESNKYQDPMHKGKGSILYIFTDNKFSGTISNDRAKTHNYLQVNPLAEFWNIEELESGYYDYLLNQIS